MAVIVLLLAVVPGTAAVASDLRPVTNAGAEAQVLDRTVRCSTAFIGGARSITALAHQGSGRTAGAWDRPASARVRTGAEGGSQYTLLDSTLAWVAAGQPQKDATVIQSPNPGVDYPFKAWGTLAWNTRLCRASPKELPLSAKGLAGGSAGTFDEGVDCDVPAHVLIRLRASMLPVARPAGFRQFLRITAPLLHAELAVGTDKGKPLAYSEVLASGKARLLTARGCMAS